MSMLKCLTMIMLWENSLLTSILDPPVVAKEFLNFSLKGACISTNLMLQWIIQFICMLFGTYGMTWIKELLFGL